MSNDRTTLLQELRDEDLQAMQSDLDILAHEAVVLDAVHIARRLLGEVERLRAELGGLDGQPSPEPVETPEQSAEADQDGVR